MSSPAIQIKPALGATGAIVAYAFSQGGSAAIGSNLTYPLLFSAGASLVWDVATPISSTVTGLFNGDARMGRAAYILGVELAGLTIMYPILNMQERVLFGALGAAGAYLMSSM